MKRFKLFALAAVAAAFMIAPQGASAAPAMKVKLSDQNARGTVDLYRNGVLLIDLASNPAKGKWKITSHNDRVMRALSLEGRMLRGNATQEFSFKALNQGTDLIKLDYVSPSGKITKSFTAKVRVGAKAASTTPLKPAKPADQ